MAIADKLQQIADNMQSVYDAGNAAGLRGGFRRQASGVFAEGYVAPADYLDGFTSIRFGAFANCYLLSGITIPDTIQSLGKYAFYGCHHLSLASINIPEGITEIPDYCFYNCPSAPNLPSTLTTIGPAAFGYARGTGWVIPENVTAIRSIAFINGSLSEIELKPTTPPTLSSDAFLRCNNLSRIIVPAGTLATYQAAANWAAYSDIMEEKV